MSVYYGTSYDTAPPFSGGHVTAIGKQYDKKQCYSFKVGDTRLYFSYWTLVAVEGTVFDGQWVRARADRRYSRTTSDHINAMGLGYFPEVPEEELAKTLDRLLAAQSAKTLDRLLAAQSAKTIAHHLTSI